MTDVPDDVFSRQFLLGCKALPKTWICLRWLEKSKKYSPKWWFDGDSNLPWYKVNNHLQQIQETQIFRKTTHISNINLGLPGSPFFFRILGTRTLSPNDLSNMATGWSWPLSFQVLHPRNLTWIPKMTPCLKGPVTFAFQGPSFWISMLDFGGCTSFYIIKNHGPMVIESPKCRSVLIQHGDFKSFITVVRGYFRPSSLQFSTFDLLVDVWKNPTSIPCIPNGIWLALSREWGNESLSNHHHV